MMRNHRPVTAEQAMRASSLSVDEAATPRAILAAMERAGVDELPVVTGDGRLAGMVERRAVERRLYDRGDEEASASAIAEAPVAQAAPGEPIEDAVDKMLAAHLGVLPIVSARDRLDGLLLLDDVRDVPGLIEFVVDRRRRGLAADGGVGVVAVACGLASAGLGLVLLALWAAGPAYGLPRWVAWVDGIAALLALVGAGLAPARDMVSAPLWAVAGVGLCFAALNAHAWRDSASSTWLQFLFGIAFLLMAAVVGSPLPRRLRRRWSSRFGPPRFASPSP
jgi:CBS domain-containing protein